MSTERIEELRECAEEKKYNDFVRRGDDFFRIELFKSAKEMYEQALLLKPDDESTITKKADCERLIRRDTKRVLIVLPFIIIAVATVIMFKFCR